MATKKWIFSFPPGSLVESWSWGELPSLGRRREGLVGGRPRLQVSSLPTQWPRVNFSFSAKYFMIFWDLNPKNQTINLPNQRKFFLFKGGLILSGRSLERINVFVWRRRPPRRKEGKKFHKNLFFTLNDFVPTQLNWTKLQQIILYLDAGCEPYLNYSSFRIVCHFGWFGSVVSFSLDKNCRVYPRAACPQNFCCRLIPSFWQMWRQTLGGASA